MLGQSERCECDFEWMRGINFRVLNYCRANGAEAVEDKLHKGTPRSAGQIS